MITLLKISLEFFFFFEYFLHLEPPLFSISFCIVALGLDTFLLSRHFSFQDITQAPFPFLPPFPPPGAFFASRIRLLSY